ncbi:hypothetical protein SKAU_G00311510 [Synaphobranchus kaupii]|uniref:Uncharacterized protein n=1 Tax=Synaphobranchus kaupii TaxID=118154 RepID=A0A9Q1ERW7_SYNKA|nr:hypothetical protein SKAU_G00311510 [Synaphobranchus kaupii]
MLLERCDLLGQRGTAYSPEARPGVQGTAQQETSCSGRCRGPHSVTRVIRCGLTGATEPSLCSSEEE